MSAFYPSQQNKAILVKNIPPKVHSDKIIIHFQRRSNGGCGDVKSVTHPRSKYDLNEAVVEFENHESMKAVLQHPVHMLNENRIVVTEFPYQLLGETEVELSESTMSKLSRKTDVFLIIKDNTGVSFVEKNGKHFMTGQLYQVMAAADRIEMLIEERNSPNISSTKLHDGSDVTTDNSSDSDQTTVDVDKNVFSFMKILKPKKIQNISKKYKVCIEESGSKISFIPNQSKSLTGNPDITGAAKSFNNLYFRFSSVIQRKSIETKFLSNSTPSKINEAVDFIMKKNPKVYISKAVSEQDKKLIILATSESEADQEIKTLLQMFPLTQNEELACYWFGNVKIVVIRGDFRNERTDAILSEVDFMGAGKVVAACNDSVKAEINDWKQSKDILFTVGGGDLQCKRVIHYTIHRPISELKLEEQIRKGIEKANDLKMKTISVPVDCIGEGLESKATILAVLNEISSFLSECRVTSKNVYISDIHFVVASRSELQDVISTISARLGEMDSSSSVSSASSMQSISASSSSDTSSECCPICLDEMSGAVALKTLDCKHAFHQSCIDKAFTVSKKCPMCMRYYGKVEGTQPRHATMHSTVIRNPLPGYKCDTIQINYNIPSGTQGPEHPNPGARYRGTSRTAYLPNDTLGKELLHLLKKAFDARLTFTVGRSVTTGCDNCVTWNDIHHKTSMHGGPANFGYPDQTYLTRLRQELADKGITN
uniref:uncharacterized protein LOC120331836 n=1 Tax=Styela clava TaxID=7725 RepID=UPI00193A083A|nr:uncharacterized protein LOC120331836 [Styela clava]